MDAIVTHDLTDFDGFAAAVAAQKLYPGAVIVLGHRLGSGLGEFLALHRDRFPTLGPAELDPGSVTRLVLVDVRRRSRLGEHAAVLSRALAGEIDVHVYDHHAASDDDVSGSLEVIEPVGSATTLLVEALGARGVALDAVEATLLSLGIHADTGSLTYGTTTPRDATALAWLLEHGVSLAVQSRYLHRGLSARQRALLATVLGNVERKRISGLAVGFAVVTLPRAFTGFDEVVSEAAELEGLPALFAIFCIGARRVQVIGRARSPACDVGRALAELGGGGHAGAGSAVVRHGDAGAVLDRLVAVLGETLPRQRVVADVMSSPVESVAPQVLLGSLAGSLHSGVPVMEAGRLVGIVSRRDVERAARDDRLALPVSSCMTRDVITTTASTPLAEALALMESRDVGRLPVLRQGRLVGIVSRADALDTLYGT